MAEDETPTEEIITPVVEKTPLEKIKESNAEMEEQLVIARTHDAEVQSIEAKRLLGGKSETGQAPEKEIDPKEKAKNYGESIMKGKIPNGE